MTADPKEGRTSVLATLTQSVMAEKKTAARGDRTLTPVAGEVRPEVLPRTTAMFPNDMPQEVIGQKVLELDRIIGHLVESRDALAALVEAPAKADAPVDLEAVRKQKELEADERAAAPNFNADFKAKQEAAQAQVFTSNVAVDDQPEEVSGTALPNMVEEWVCPDHGKATTKRSNKTGREFIGCPDCNLFKR